MKEKSMIACHHCDFLMSSPAIKTGDCALCQRCNHKLTRLDPNAINRLLAFAITGLIFLFLTTQFDLLTLNLSGHISQLDLFSSANKLYFDDYKILAILVFIFIFILPVMILCFIVLFIFSLKTGVGKWSQTSLLRLIFLMMPWAMVEVFLVGILVSLIKLVAIAQIDLGWSFWTYSVFCFCYVKILTLVDRYQFWSWIDEAHI